MTAAPPSPRRAPWLIPVVAGAIAVFLGLAVAVALGAVALGTAIRDARDAVPPAPVEPGVPDPPLAGDPGEPVATEPLVCAGCFTYPDATTLRIGLDAYRAIGLTRADGQTYSGYAGEEADLLGEAWDDLGGSPEECLFAYGAAPLGDTVGTPEAPAADDRVHYPSWHHDGEERYWLTEGVRLFDDSAAATAYLTGVQTAVAGCTTYALPGSGWSATVTPAPAFDLPDAVAAYGWVESGGVGRYYGVDLQRGNLVLRLTLNSDGAGPTEEEFRAFAESYAELLAELEPTG